MNISAYKKLNIINKIEVLTLPTTPILSSPDRSNQFAMYLSRTFFQYFYSQKTCKVPQIFYFLILNTIV